MRTLDVWGAEVSGGVGAVRSSDSVRWIDGDQRRLVQAGFSSLSCGPRDISSKGPYSQRDHISVPNHHKNYRVLRGWGHRKPFSHLKQDRGDVILKVCATTTPTLQPMVTHLFIVADISRICWCRLH